MVTSGTLLMTIAARAFWGGKLSGRVDPSEQDVKEIKADIKRVHQLMYHQMEPVTADS